MKSRHWIELMMPTLLVGVGWLAVSGATTAYIMWLDGAHERVMSENVTSIRAAAEMQHALWQMHAALQDAPNSERDNGRAESAADEFRNALDRAESSWSTPEEQRAIGDLRQWFADYAVAWKQASSAAEPREAAAGLVALATEIANRCHKLQLFNQRLIEQRTAGYRTWTSRILWVRLLVVVLGPPIGVWLGFRMATRVGRRIANIQVSLAGVSDELGTVRVSATPQTGHFGDIEHQIRNVANRIHEVMTELQETQREAQRNERLAAIGQLAAGVAHGLRNPLTSVKLLVQTVLSKATPQSATAEQLSVVQDEIHRMEQTIQSLLDYAKPPARQHCRHDLRETIRRAVNLVQGRAAQDGITTELPSGEAPLWIKGDPEQLHQVFVNLLLNGMDAIPRGGTLRIDVRPHTPVPGIGLADGNGHVDCCEVCISDDGPGIPASLLDRIFEPFVTTKDQGTGLGLAISRRFIEEHGGRLTASNRPNGGASFTIQLPDSADHDGTDTLPQLKHAALT